MTIISHHGTNSDTITLYTRITETFVEQVTKKNCDENISMLDILLQQSVSTQRLGRLLSSVLCFWLLVCYLDDIKGDDKEMPEKSFQPNDCKFYIYLSWDNNETMQSDGQTVDKIFF